MVGIYSWSQHLGTICKFAWRQAAPWVSCFAQNAIPHSSEILVGFSTLAVTSSIHVGFLHVFTLADGRWESFWSFSQSESDISTSRVLNVPYFQSPPIVIFISSMSIWRSGIEQWNQNFFCNDRGFTILDMDLFSFFHSFCFLCYFRFSFLVSTYMRTSFFLKKKKEEVRLV